MGDKCVEVLLDTGCNKVKIRKDLVSQKEVTEMKDIAYDDR